MTKTNGLLITRAISHWHWCFNEKLHKLDGPVIQDEWKTIWCINGEVHREDGPAIEWANGTKEWYLKGVQYSEQEFNLYKLEKQLRLELTDNNKDNPKVKI